MIEAYPLHWPVGFPRSHSRKNSKFKQTLGAARDYLKDEIRRIGGTDLVISTNIPTKDNGDLRSDWQRYRLDDPGVAVYFKRKGKDICLCTDKYERVWENVYALARSIEAMRQIERDGVSDFIDRSFTGFKAIPEKISTNIWETLGLKEQPPTEATVHLAFKNQAKKAHPDAGGSADAFHHLQEVYKLALQLFN